MADILNIGISGLISYQSALNTTSHNISNVGTEGYSRQQVTLATRTPLPAGNGYFGQGVTVTGVERLYDQFLVGQVRTYQSQSSSSAALYDLAEQVDNLLADPDAGLSPALESFFASVQDVSDNPSSIPARETMLTSGETLVERFSYLGERFDELQARTKRLLDVTAQEINEYAQSIAGLNREIARATSSTGQTPNDLLDRRDLMLEELSKRVSINTLVQDDGSVNVFIGNGQSLVVGGSVSQVKIQENEYGTDFSVYIGSGTTFFDVTNYISGGALGGNLGFVEQVLDPARNSLGRIAMGMATAFNAQHQLGIDLTNTQGGDFFTMPTPASYPSGNNTATGAPALGIDDVGALTTANYELRYTGVTWTLKNLSTGQYVPLTTGSGTAADPWIADGVTIAVDAIAGEVAGDKFLITPTRNGAGDIGMQVTDASRIAAAGPFVAKAATDANGVPTNTGSGSMGSISVARGSSSSPLIPLGGSITLTYNSVTQQYALTLPGGYSSAPATVAYNPATDDGATRSFTISDGTEDIVVSFKLGGVPQNGDQFILSNATSATSDNRNALALAGLETAKVLVNGTASLQSGYGQLVADVGVTTRRASINSAAEATLLGQAQAAREEVSGVNLDEEAANLIRFQQAYQANAQVIAAANVMFDTLLNAIR